MALDYRSELRRPVTLVLLALAVLGWFVSVVALVGQSQSRSRYRDEIRQLSNTQTSLKSELDQWRQAGGSLADFQAKVRAAQEHAQQSEAARAQAHDQALAAQNAIENQKRLVA